MLCGMFRLESQENCCLISDVPLPEMRAKSLDSGLAFSGGNGSLLVLSSGQFHVTKLAQTMFKEVIITMRASLRH